MRGLAASRSIKGAQMLAASLFLVGCTGEGFSGLQAEWNRKRGSNDPFAIISASHERAVVAAKGRQVAIEPADGFCLAEESIETSGRSAFVLIGDCALDAVKSGTKGARGELQLPRGIPGFITVSVSGGSAVPLNGSKETTLNNLGEFFDTAEGRRLLGRGGDGQKVSVVKSQRIGDSLFVLVDDKDEQPVPLLSSRFWRSFVQLNDRLAVVTMSGFRDRPLSEDDMLEHLIAQVKRLRVANRTPVNEEPTYIAERNPRTQITLLDPSEADDVQKISDLKPTAVIVATGQGGDDADEGDQVASPKPTARPRKVAEAARAAELAARQSEDNTTSETAESPAAATVAETVSTTADRSRAARTAKTATKTETALTPEAQERPSKSVTVVLDPSIETLGSGIAPKQAPSAPRRPRRG